MKPLKPLKPRAKKVAAKATKRNPTLERTYDSAIIQTLNYKAIFKCGATFHQLATVLACTTPVELDYATFNSRLKSLIKTKKIRRQKNIYHTVKSRPLNWTTGALNAQTHLASASPALGIIKHIKWLKLLAVTGSVAAYNAKKQDDIDLFIITEHDRLWLTRLFIVIILKTMQMYRSDQEPAGKICPNIYITEEVLRWPQAEQNVYIAHEILTMHPIVNKNDTYFNFLKRNEWVFDHFAAYQVWLPSKPKLAKTKHNSKLVDTLEFVCMVLQLWYMRSKQTTEVVRRNFVHFNKQDHTQRVLEAYREDTN